LLPPLAAVVDPPLHQLVAVVPRRELAEIPEVLEALALLGAVLVQQRQTEICGELYAAGDLSKLRPDRRIDDLRNLPAVSAKMEV